METSFLGNRPSLFLQDIAVLRIFDSVFKRCQKVKRTSYFFFYCFLTVLGLFSLNKVGVDEIGVTESGTIFAVEEID